MEEQADAVVPVFGIVSAVVEHPHMVIIEAQRSGHGAVVHLQEKQAQHVVRGGCGDDAAEEIFPFRCQKFGLGRIAAPHEIQEDIHLFGRLARFGDAVPPPVFMPFQPPELAAEFVPVFLAQARQVIVPSFRKREPRRHVFLRHGYAATPFASQIGEHRQCRGILSDGVEIKAGAAVGADVVQQRGIERVFSALGNDEIVVVEGFAVSNE